MPNKKTAAAPIPNVTNIGATIDQCSVVNTSAAKEHTRASVVALAGAIEANARAVIAVAEALKGVPATMHHGIHLDNLRGA